MKTILLDTNVLLFDTLFPHRLSLRMKEVLFTENHFCCADISLLEIATLIKKKRLHIQEPIDVFLNFVLNSRKTKVLPINSSIAALSQSLPIKHKDPADLLIIATALYYQVPLLTSDEVMREVTGLNSIF